MRQPEINESYDAAPGQTDAAAPKRSAERTRLLAVGAAVLAGVGAPVQARLNGELGARLHDGILAGFLSTFLGMALLVIVVPSTAAGRRALGRVRAARGSNRLRWWHLVGGLAGAVFISSQGLTVGTLGVAVFTVAAVAGTSAASLFVDRAGLGPSGRHAITAGRLAGALLGICAVAVAGHDRFGNARTLWFVALPALAGAGLAWQSAINAQLSAAAKSPSTATMINFIGAASALGVASLVSAAVKGLPPRMPRELWLYSGGFLGLCFVAVTVVVVRHTGVLVFGLANVCGQLFGAIAVDAVAPRPGASPGASTWIAVGLTALAVAVATVSRRPRRPLSPEEDVADARA